MNRIEIIPTQTMNRIEELLSAFAQLPIAEQEDIRDTSPKRSNLMEEYFYAMMNLIISQKKRMTKEEFQMFLEENDLREKALEMTNQMQQKYEQADERIDVGLGEWASENAVDLFLGVFIMFGLILAIYFCYKMITSSKAVTEEANSRKKKERNKKSKNKNFTSINHPTKKLKIQQNIRNWLFSWWQSVSLLLFSGTKVILGFWLSACNIVKCLLTNIETTNAAPKTSSINSEKLVDENREKSITNFENINANSSTAIINSDLMKETILLCSCCSVD